MTNDTIVRKIWGLCHILRGDGVSYHQYVSELTYLLFLKIAQENGTEKLLPEGYRWGDLAAAPTEGLVAFYREMLTHLGNHAKSDVIRDIFMFPTTVFTHDENLVAVVEGIATIEWGDVSADGFGRIYEGLLQHSADVRSGAGQYFTPRELIDIIVSLVKPALGDLIQDPAVGSGGFLVSADRYIRSQSSEKDYLSTTPRYEGVEIEKNTRRIALMNTMLNGLDAKIIYGDALTSDAEGLSSPDIVLANPPFGVKSGSKRKLRSNIPFPSASKQVAFLQHIYLGLKPGGRAAVVLPDNVLFEDGVTAEVRSDLLRRCNLHTILKLPSGIFTSAGVKTNVLFFSKPKEPVSDATEAVWLFDMRAQMPNFGKTRRLAASDFAEFLSVFGEDPDGGSSRQDMGEDGRFRRFAASDLIESDYNLAINWLPDTNGHDVSDDPYEAVEAILSHLRAAVEEIEMVSEALASE